MPFLKVRDLLDNPILDTKFLPSLVLVSQMYQKKKKQLWNAQTASLILV